jgi:arylsulfatase A-like enzyme
MPTTLNDVTQISPDHGAVSRARPNILLILADDMGYADIGCFGGEIHTPNLDRLGYGGVRFSQMYNAARCCPSRAALLTGLYPHQAGVGHLAYDLGLPAYRGRLNERCVTLAETLREAGYHTCISGKWHVAGRSLSDEDRRMGREGSHPLPLERGFERWFGTVGGSCSYYSPHDLRDDHASIQPESDAFYYTDAISDAAVGMITRYGARPEPFFLYVAYTAPHWPLHALPEDVARYRGRYAQGWDAIRTARHERQRDLGLIDRRWPISPRDELAPPWDEIRHRDWEDARMAVYAAQVDRMDAGIGRMLAMLETLGIAQDTLVIFLSDNGGCAELLREDGILDPPLRTTRRGLPVRQGNRPDVMPGPADTFMSYDLPWANVSDTPFRLYKHWVHEGGIATPFIARWPGQIPAGGIVHEPAHLVDIYATCLDLAEARYPSEYRGRAIHPCEGESFAAALRGLAWQRQAAICWEHEGNLAVRQGSLKLVRMYPGRWELYDMERDRTELNDLASRYPDKVEELAAIYARWAERCEVPAWEVISKLERDRVVAYERRLGGPRVWGTSRPVW